MSCPRIPKFQILRDDGDNGDARCTGCGSEFYWSPCGEDGLYWDESSKVLRLECPDCGAKDTGEDDE